MSKLAPVMVTVAPTGAVSGETDVIEGWHKPIANGAITKKITRVKIFISRYVSLFLRLIKT